MAECVNGTYRKKDGSQFNNEKQYFHKHRLGMLLSLMLFVCSISWIHASNTK